MSGLFVNREKELLEINSKLDQIFKSVEVKSVKLNVAKCTTFSSGTVLSKTSKISPSPREQLSTKNTSKTSTNEVSKTEKLAPTNLPTKSNHTVSVSVPKKIATNRSFISSEVTIKCLKAKLQILQQELENSRKDNFVKTELLSERAVQLEKAVVENENTMKIHRELENQFAALQKKNFDYDSLLKDKNNLLTLQESRLEDALKEVKKTTHDNCLLEKRLHVAQADVELLQKNAKMDKEREKDMFDNQKKERNLFNAQIKQLGQQRQELIGAYKSQLLLLDNLKRQNMCLEQGKLIQAVERDFIKILNYK